MRKMLANKAEKLVDADIARRYNLQLTVNSYDYDKGTISYDNWWGDGSQ